MTQGTQTDGTSPTLCHQAPSGKATGEGGAARAAQQALPRMCTAPPRARIDPPRPSPIPHSRGNLSTAAGSKSIGAKFEAHALAFLQRQRLRLIARNVVSRGGEIDLVMREPDGALVFVEVRARARTRYGGALASVTRQKRQRLVRAAQAWLAAHAIEAPHCRFDVVAFEAGRLVWLRDAFRADDI